MGPAVVDPERFRQVLGQYPSGVCVVTAVTAEGTPTGMVVGSFTSVSLDPPMVAFYPSAVSTTWPRIRDADAFCVNVLAADQDQVCRQFATAPLGRRFEGVPFRAAPSGAPVIEGSVAWIDCKPAAVQPAGDHYLVLGRVTHLEVESPKLPLLFFRGGYGSFSPLSFTASDVEGVLARQLRHLDIVRGVVQALPDSGLRALVTTRSRNRVIVIGQLDSASTGTSPEPATLVGQQLPFRPPGPSVFQAWSEPAAVDAWLAGFPAAVQERERSALASIRARGYSVGLVGDGQRQFALALEQLAVRPNAVTTDELDELISALHYDPPELSGTTLREVRLVTAPVFGRSGCVELAVTVFGFAHHEARVRRVVDQLLECTREATRLLGGRAPT